MVINEFEKDLGDIAAKCRRVAWLAKREDFQDTCDRVYNQLRCTKQSISKTAELIEVTFYAGENNHHGGHYLSQLGGMYYWLGEAFGAIESKDSLPSRASEGILRSNLTASLFARFFNQHNRLHPFPLLSRSWFSPHANLLHQV